MILPIIIVVCVYVILLTARSSSKGNRNSNGNNYGDNYGNTGKYKNINSHYSQSTLNGNKMQQSPLAGQFVPNGAVSNHNHAYEHKVEPIDEVSVHEKFEDRKEAYRERKAQMKADLPKTSYSQAEQANKSSNARPYQSIHRNAAKNGDNGYFPNRSEKAIKCGYCGATNIIPWNANVKYNCYFCREEL